MHDLFFFNSAKIIYFFGSTIILVKMEISPKFSLQSLPLGVILNLIQNLNMYRSGIDKKIQVNTVEISNPACYVYGLAERQVRNDGRLLH